MKLEREGKYAALELSGEINVQTVGQFKNILFRVIESGDKYIILDFGHVTYINNMGINVLREFYQYVVEKKGDLKFRGLNPHVKEIFDMLDVNNSIPVLNSNIAV